MVQGIHQEVEEHNDIGISLSKACLLSFIDWTPVRCCFSLTITVSERKHLLCAAVV